MFKLFFSSGFSIVSTILTVVFIVIFSIVMSQRTNITHWGLLVFVIFVLGLSMSLISGFRDDMGSKTPVISSSPVMLILCLLGASAMITGIVMLIRRNTKACEIGFYLLSSIIIVKLVLTEGFRIIKYLSK